ncbi:ribosome-releasing factor 2 [Tropilaelaps mercedesae]|uniref:Ribosome-releasing factor 2 n=1 Tax=Tropilaelaps mercedesae TaxID=418985 RepID=A0A1V9XZ43_9ACAR|nr:ribosome-releasing factor 2 [Tropilaelaps mercedesae]
MAVVAAKVILRCQCRYSAFAQRFGVRWMSSQTVQGRCKTRNIGIIAHIDAGKTTTTERMLFYSGYTRTMGEVHDGDTVTDFMPQERERGITITSAAISFPWRKHVVNLIDTPGHVDFTVEVERSLRVLDGAVTILDASAGVEAQTMTVWRQADRYRLPRVIYLNKMDKPRADLAACLNDIKQKLHIQPLVCQIPVMNPKGGHFCGLFDLVRMQELVWDSGDSTMGVKFKVIPAEQSKVLELALEQRGQLVESLAAVDDVFAERFVLADAEPTNQEVADAIRKATISSAAVPLLCGSSYKNIGVQPLLDAVVDYLPDPSFALPEEVRKFYSEDDTVAIAFKIVHSKFKGPLTFVRLYSGRIDAGQKIYILNRKVSEKCGELLQVNADEFISLGQAAEGSIIAIAGLKHTRTGDTILSSASTGFAAMTKAAKAGKSALLFGIQSPEPVFQCRIEAPSLGQQNQLETALACLQREDPSLVVTQHESTGETLIAGMGELHIDIIRDRIKREYKVEPHLGRLQIAYRERLAQDICGLQHVLDKTLAGHKHYVEVGIDIRKVTCSNKQKQSLMEIHIADENRPSNFYRKALESGVKLTLCQGPLLGFPLMEAQVVLTHFVATSSTGIPMVTAAIATCIQNGLRASPQAVELLEPYMRLEISLPEEFVGKTLADLSRRRASILSIGQRQDSRIISARCPLCELRQYSTELRTLTSGRAMFSMELDNYVVMNPGETTKLLQTVSGLQ